jgi:hypothetical protein
MKRIILTLTAFLSLIPALAQENSNQLKFKFYGFVRNDFFYDSRQSVIANEGLLFLYPKDKALDAVGNDLNAQSSSGFYSLSTRPGIDVSGLRVFEADVTAKMEADFAGFSGNATVLRIRLAFIKMNWEKSSLLIGQNWHPFFQTLVPGQITLSTGAPFHAFARSPQVRYDYQLKNFTLSAAGIYQYQHTSPGPEGKSNLYQKHAVLPELTAVVGYKNQSITAGVGINLLSLKPRLSSEIDNKIYKVDENLSSLSYQAYLGYTENLFSVGLKTTYGQNNGNLTMLGGYGVKSIDPETGKREYSNFNFSSSFLNLSYGKKYKGNLFAGYIKNFGSDHALVENSSIYGDGMTIDNLTRLSGTFSYNIPHFMLGVEYEFAIANYGNTDSFNWNTGRYSSTHAISNHRISGVISYIF